MSAPFPDARWRMIDRGGCTRRRRRSARAGVVTGARKLIRRPGFSRLISSMTRSGPVRLGLESLLQLLKIVAAKRWGAGPSAVFESPGLGQSHRWTYRGQIVPANRRVKVQAEIKAVR